MLKLDIYVVGKAAYHLLEWGAGAGQSSHTSGRKNTPGGDPCRIHQGNSTKFVLSAFIIRGRDLAKWLERLAVNAKVAITNSRGFDPSILRQSGIREAADEAVLNDVHKKKQSKKDPPLTFIIQLDVKIANHFDVDEI
jgi:hypothetical protein